MTAKSANETTTARYTAGYPTLGTFSIDGDNGGTAVAPARVALPAFIWSNGVYTTVGAHTFTRNATPDGPYNSFALKATVTDPDGAAIAGAVLSNTTAIRSGRLRLVNTYGSELLAIRVPLRAESYTGTGWSLHAADSCTAAADQRLRHQRHQRRPGARHPVGQPHHPERRPRHACLQRHCGGRQLRSRRKSERRGGRYIL
ncbi:MAG: DUF6701 domain-containing protein [Saprospiraceae bacterium]